MSRSICMPSLGAIAIALLAAGNAAAQEAPAPADEGITVTGSRIARDGYTAPTPLTVVGEDDIAAAAPANLADYVNDIPALVGSTAPANSNLSISAGTAGVNALNLRQMGASRTLVLLDGQRSVTATLGGVVDVNNMPQGLVKSVEIVTGGASAAYGSDAVTGVVNFILDKDFTGVKGAVDAGITTHGDGASYRANLTIGQPFAGGSGHILVDGEYSRREGIHGVPRDWNDRGYYIVTNPAYAAGNGQPEWLVTPNAGLSNASPGGIITSGPLRGTFFGPGGTPGTFQYGTTRDPWMIGGAWQSVQVNDNQSLDPEETRMSMFGRISYEVTDGIELFAQGSFNRTENEGWLGVQLNQGNVTIRSDNAFIPPSVRTQLANAGLASFTLGTTNADFPIRKSKGERDTQRYVVGANGAFDAIGTRFKWDVYYQLGITDTMEMAADITNNSRLALAQDAVFAPAGNAIGVPAGTIVCRSTLTNPANGCVPLNRMGIGVADPRAMDYVLGDPYRNQQFRQEVFAANLSFDAIQLPAGPLSIAVGGEHRRERVSGQVLPEYQTGWFVGNFLPTFGSYSVTEGYIEALVPIIEGLDLNGAFRGTDYSLSGYVSTWKVGATFQPIPDIRLRATRSRDIRAPNLGELFTAGSTRTNVLIDPFNANASVQFSGVTRGNQALKPEQADQWGVGVVLQPGFIPGLAASVDYYDIKITGGIGSAAAQTIVDRCFEGVTTYCAAIVRGPNAFGTNLLIYESPFNFAEQKARGLDIEASYRTRLPAALDGNLTLRAMATHYLENRTDTGLTPPTDSVGQNSLGGTPSWLYRVSAAFDVDPVAVTVTGRGISSGVYDNTYVTCTTGCPASTANARTINTNEIDGAFYVDLTVTWDLKLGGGKTELFANVTNLFDKDPPVVASGPAGSAYATPSTNQQLYDLLGRTFRAGMRFKF